MSFLDQVYAAGAPRETQADIVEYYQEEYPGHKTNKKGVTTYEWQSRLSDDLSNVLGVKRASIMRRFQKGRKEKEVSKKHQDEYELLGGMLPPKAPEGGYHIHGTYQVKYSDDCEERTFDEKITGDNAKELAKMAEEDMLQALANYRQTEDFDTQGPSICGEPDLQVEAIEE